MANRPFKELSDKVVEVINVHEQNVKLRPQTPESIDIQIDSFGVSDNTKSINTIANVKYQYRQLYNEFQKIIDVEEAISRVETRAYRRALLYRTFTTLAIGACIIIIYAVATYFSVNMPLSRMGY